MSEFKTCHVQQLISISLLSWSFFACLFLFMSKKKNWIQGGFDKILCFTVYFPFPLRCYSTIEVMRKCQHHDLTAFILENKVKEKDKVKKGKQKIMNLQKYIIKSTSSLLLLLNNSQLCYFEVHSKQTLPVWVTPFIW